MVSHDECRKFLGLFIKLIKEVIVRKRKKRKVRRKIKNMINNLKYQKLM